MTLERCELVGDGDATTAVAASSTIAHWVATDDVQQRHGSGYAGDVEPGARLRVMSAVRGPWEVRLVRVDEVLDAQRCVAVRVSGWALSADDRPESAQAESGGMVLRAGALTSIAWSPELGAQANAAEREDAAPDGRRSAVPFVDLPLTTGRWLVTALALTGDGAKGRSEPPGVAIDTKAFTITWPDGPKTTIPLTP